MTQSSTKISAKNLEKVKYLTELLRTQRFVLFVENQVYSFLTLSKISAFSKAVTLKTL